jgi:ankyrin repeat protein
LVGLDPKLAALKPIADYLEPCYLESCFPHVWNESRLQTETPEPAMSQNSLCQMFIIVAYLASNNILERTELRRFLEMVSTNGYLGQLSLFLQIDSANVRAFRASILRVCFTGLRSLSLSEIAHIVLSLDRRACSGRLGGELLHLTASTHGSTDAAKLLVSCGADIDFVQDLGIVGLGLGTPLCRAILSRSTQLINYLVSAGCRINERFCNVTGDGEETALTIAIREGDLFAIQILLDSGANFDPHMLVKGYSIMEYAKMHLPQLFKLLRESSWQGEFPEILQLIHKAEKGNRTLSQFLLERNILQEQDLERALCQAVKLGSCGAVRTLLQRGVDPNARKSRLIDNASEDNLPIILALSAHDNDIAADLFYLLMKAGADINDDILMRICRSAIDRENSSTLLMLGKAGYNAVLFGPLALEFEAGFGSLATCGFFLDIGAPINAYGAEGRSGLQAAARNGHLTLVQYLIDRGADINFPASDESGLTALQAAVLGGYTDVMDYLIDAGADIRAPPAASKWGVTVLEAAAAADFMEYDEGFDTIDDELSKARKGDHVSIFRRLIALGAPINRTNSSNGTVLHRLLDLSRIKCVELVLQGGAQIEDREPSLAMKTPIQVAAANGQIEALQLLLKHGADVNAPAGAEFGRTALQAATSAEYPDPNIIDLLLRHDADVNAPPAVKGGVTALQGAAIRGDIQTARVLLARKADVNTAPALEQGRTAVEGAAEHGRLDMVRLLLTVGAKADPSTGFAKAIRLAEKNGHLVVADLLRENETAASLFSSSTEYHTPSWLPNRMICHEDLEEIYMS